MSGVMAALLPPMARPGGIKVPAHSRGFRAMNTATDYTPPPTVVAGAGGSASDLRQRGDRRLPPARPRGPVLVHVHARENFFGSFGWRSPLARRPWGGAAYKMAGNERQSGHRQVLSQPDGRSCTGPSRRRLRLSDRLGLLLHDLAQATLSARSSTTRGDPGGIFSYFFGRPAPVRGGVAAVVGL